MKQTELTIIENLPLCTDVYRVVLAGDTSAVTAPGQFVNLKLDGFFLRRPISVCDWDTGQLSIIYKDGRAGPPPPWQGAPRRRAGYAHRPWQRL